MSKEITASQWVALTRGERIALCRRLAEEAETSAKSAEPKFQQGYNEVAGGWQMLAAEVALSR
jgi:hypothetical protein